MTDNKTTGRTFFDWVSEHPRQAFFMFITLLILLPTAVYILLRNDYKIGKDGISKDIAEKPVKDTAGPRQAPVLPSPAEPVQKTTSLPAKKTVVVSEKGNAPKVTNRDVKNQNNGINYGTIGDVHGEPEATAQQLTDMVNKLVKMDSTAGTLKNIAVYIMPWSNSKKVQYQLIGKLKHLGYEVVNGEYMDDEVFKGVRYKVDTKHNESCIYLGNF